MIAEQIQNGQCSKWDIVIKELRKSQVKLTKKNLNNEIKIIQSIYGVQRIQNLIRCYVDGLTPSIKKSSQLSLEIRNEGNKIYKRNDNLFESAFLYTLSLKCSENTNDLSFAHGNRGAVLMKLGFNKVARNDCEEAIKLNHPDPFKIFERMCSLSNGCIKDMKKNVAELEKYVKKGSKQSKEILQKYKTRLKAMEKETFVDDSTNPTDEFSKLSLNNGQNDLKVKQMYSDVHGRYVIAEKSIKKDDVICSEVPFAFVPVHNYGIKKYFNTDCENCGLVNIWPFLCLECRHAAYCSSQCRELHHKIHKYECEGYKINLFFDIGIAHLSLRVLITGFPALMQKLDALTEDASIYKNNVEKIFEKIMEMSSDFYQNYFTDDNDEDAKEFQEYARVLCLQPNLFREKSFPMRNIPYAYTAYMLTIYLRQYTSFFEDIIGSSQIKDFLDDNGWNLIIGALLFRHMGQLVSNGHAIVDFRQNIFTTDALNLMLLKNQPNGGGLHLLLKSQRVFTGIFPKISMLNHSCEPNIRNCFEGSSLTIRAAVDIPENGEILNCYGPHWKLMSFNERQDTLKMQYNFDCKCMKCSQSNDEYRFNNSVLCRICNKRIFYPDKRLRVDDDDDFLDDDIENDEDFRLRCDDCKKIHENVHMKKFFALLAQQHEPNFTMNQLYTTYLSAIFGMGSLDEIRYHMTEMMLHTLITNRNVINLQNANIPLTLSIELLNVKENLYGQYSVEFVEAGFFFLDVVSILIDKGIITEHNNNPLIEQTIQKFITSTDICSSNIKSIIHSYISRYCYLCVKDP